MKKKTTKKTAGKKKDSGVVKQSAAGSDREWFLMAAHQLRAPIVSMQTVLKALMGGDVKDSGQAAELLKQVYTRSEDMMRLINDVMALGEAAKAFEAPGAASCDPATVMAAALEKVRPIADAGSVTIASFEDSGASALPISEDALEHVFVNLVENAVKYSPAGSTVKVDLSRARGKMTFRVKDNGIGIPEADMGKIFDEFHRAANARKAVKRGTGLGLSIVRKIVEGAGGGIAVESVVGEGSEFIVTLPGRRAGTGDINKKK